MGILAGPPRRIEEAIWRDLFYLGDWQNREIVIETKGDGEESRCLKITRAPSQLFIPLADQTGKQIEETTTAPLRFVWRDSSNHEHTATPTVTSAGVQFTGTEEDLPGFLYFAASQPVPAHENAARFPELSQAGKLRRLCSLQTIME